MNDVVEQLREATTVLDEPFHRAAVADAMERGAIEIERLRTALAWSRSAPTEEQKREIERLRSALTRVVHFTSATPSLSESGCGRLLAQIEHAATAALERGAVVCGSTDLRADLVSVRAELRNIAEAKRFDRERFDDDMAFADWAQSRARHALGPNVELSGHQRPAQEQDMSEETTQAVGAPLERPVRPRAWLCELAQEDGTTRTQFVEQDPDGLRWNDAGESSPYRTTPLYEAPRWLPIETAPRTSKARLVWVPENRCTYCVSWTDGNCGPGEEGDPPGWVIFGGSYRAYLRDGRVTHWMPLPEPPPLGGYGAERQR